MRKRGFAVTMLLMSAIRLAHAAPADGIVVTHARTRPAALAPALHFTGVARLTGAFRGMGAARISGATVAFEPGARTAWHAHPLGQTLIVTAGEGLVQEWAHPIHVIHEGDIVWIPPGVKHWHGATARSGMTHIAITEAVRGKTVDWMEKVSDAQYDEQPSE